MATKRGGIMTYLEEILAVKSHELFIAWFYEITWQTEIMIHLQESLMTNNEMYLTLWPRVPAKSHEKLK